MFEDDILMDAAEEYMDTGEVSWWRVLLWWCLA